MTWNVQLDDTVLKGTNADEVCTLGKGDELQAVKTVVITPVYPPHDATPEWKSDEINHWQECSICHEKLTPSCTILRTASAACAVHRTLLTSRMCLAQAAAARSAP